MAAKHRLTKEWKLQMMVLNIRSNILNSIDGTSYS